MYACNETAHVIYHVSACMYISSKYRFDPILMPQIMKTDYEVNDESVILSNSAVGFSYFVIVLHIHH